MIWMDILKRDDSLFVNSRPLWYLLKLNYDMVTYDSYQMLHAKILSLSVRVRCSPIEHACLSEDGGVVKMAEYQSHKGQSQEARMPPIRSRGSEGLSDF